MASDEPTPFFEWREQWMLDVGFMDEDHRNLADLLNTLARRYGRSDRPARRGTSERTELLEALEELGRQTRDHFRREEEVMRTLAYPGLATHKAEHDLLIAEYRAMVREISRSGSDRLEIETLEALKQWLMGHALDDDKELAVFLQHPPDQANENTP
jgi:hemerythrin-like metal-binding protein